MLTDSLYLASSSLMLMALARADRRSIPAFELPPRLTPMMEAEVDIEARAGEYPGVLDGPGVAESRMIPLDEFASRIDDAAEDC